MSLSANTVTVAVPEGVNTRRAKVVVYDNDHVLAYHSDDAVAATFGPYFHQEINRHLPPERHLTLEEVVRLTHQHYRDYGNTAVGFARQFGFPDAWAEKAYAEPQALSGTWYAANLPCCDRLPGLMSRVAEAGYVQAVLSAAHPFHAEPILAYLGVTAHVPVNLRLNQLTAGGGDKRTQVPYRYMLDALTAHGVSPVELWMVEDSPPNLVPAKQLGFRTVLVGSRRPAAADAEYIDLIYPSPTGVLEFMQHLLSGEL